MLLATTDEDETCRSRETATEWQKYKGGTKIYLAGFLRSLCS